MPKGIYERKSHIKYGSTGKKWKIKDTSKMKFFQKGNKVCVGRTPWNKGIPCSEATKRKMSKKLKGKPNENPYWLGKKRPKATRIKMSKQHQGEKCYFWKGGITKKNLIIRRGIEYRLWREAVFARDNWICQKYEIKGGRLEAHHIQNFAQFPELRFAIDNGITLSEKAHREFHKKYGKKNNTKEQIEEFTARQVVARIKGGK